MEIALTSRPSFAQAVIRLDKGDQIRAEASSMVAMSADLGCRTGFNGVGAGGPLDWLQAAFTAVLRRFLAGETLFANTYTAHRDGQQLFLAPAMVGDIERMQLSADRTVTIQAGSYLASTPGVVVDLVWGGLSMLFAGEGVFFLACRGTGDLLVCSYGGLERIEVDGGYVVDSGHVVAWEGALRHTLRRVGGWKASLLSGEGWVLAFEGRGTVWVQTRNLRAFAGWIRPFFPSS